MGRNMRRNGVKGGERGEMGRNMRRNGVKEGKRETDRLRRQRQRQVRFK